MGIVVTNNGELPHKGRFNGKDYTFLVGDPVSLSEPAAMHIFAYGKSDADKARLLIKNGWQRNGTPGDPFGPEAARARLNSFVFQVVNEEDVVKATKPKQIAPVRKPSGVNAMSSMVSENGQRKPIGGPMQLPGSSAPIAPAA